MEKKPTALSGQSRRPASVRIRTAAAGSFLAAASAAGIGTAGALPARAAESSPVTVPFAAGDGHAALPAGTLERLAGIRADLDNAVKWGSVTRTQAEGFYAQLQARILRGL